MYFDLYHMIQVLVYSCLLKLNLVFVILKIRITDSYYNLFIYIVYFLYHSFIINNNEFPK